MSAEITMTAGRAEMFYRGEVPWHGLGQKLDTYATASEALEAAGLNWKVKKVPVLFNWKGELSKCPRRCVVVREDTGAGLGTVGAGWEPLQNGPAFSFMDAITGSKEAKFEAAGSLKGGRTVWMLAKTKGIIKLGNGDDPVETYLLLANGHDGGRGVQVKLTSVRVICQNTLNAALQGEGEFISLRHSRNIGSRVKEVQERLNIVNASIYELELKMKALTEVKVNESKLFTYFEALGFNPESEEEKEKEQGLALVKAFETSPGSSLSSAKGTLWGAVNAVTYWTDHAREWKQNKSVDPREAQISRTMFGQADQLKRKAFDLALKMAA